MKRDVPDVRCLQQKHFDVLVVSFSTRLAIVLPLSRAIVTVTRVAWKIKLPFRLALHKAASVKLRGIANITLDLEHSFLAVCCVACPRYGSTSFENGVGDEVSS